MAKNRKSAGTLISEYESTGKLSSEDASALRDAPQWVIPFTDIASYLGGAIVFVGVLWIVIALMSDLSQATIDTALFMTSCGTAAVSRWLIRRGGKLVNLGECVAALSVLTLSIGIGVLLDIANVSQEAILLLASIPALLIGLALAHRTRFIGSIVVVGATQPLMAGVITLVLSDSSLAPLVFILSGSALLWFATRNIGLPIFARLAGALSVMFAAIVFSTWDGTLWRAVLGLGISGLLFAHGANIFHLEVLAAGGIGFTVTTGIAAGQLFDSPLAQGICVVSSGVLIVALATAISRKDNAIT